MSTPNTYTIARWGETFRIAVNDEIMESHYRKGELSEPHMLDWMQRNLPRGGVWIDAGANVGNHALPFALWADKVLAFEPMEVNHDLLKINAANFYHGDRIECLQLGVGADYASASAKLGGTGHNCQWELTVAERSDPPQGIQVVPIDSQVMDTDQVRVIKMDVEGMEEAALEGAMRTIRRCKPELFIEIWDEPVLKRIATMLGELGYVLTERYNAAPTFHFSASGRYPVTYTPAERLRP